MGWLEQEISRNKRKKSLKSGIKWFVAGIFTVLVIIAVIVFLLPYSDTKGVTVVRIEGTIMTGDYSGGGYIGSEYVGSQIRAAANDPLVEAIVLRIDSPGGSPAGAQEIIEDIEYAKTRKPVFVSMGDMATSAAYHISSHADKIYANRDTMTGGIGTIWTFYDVSGSLKIEGVNVSVVKSGELKDLGSQYRGLTEEEFEYVQNMVNDSFELFINDVIEQRGLNREDIEEAQLIRGEDAYSLGLIDEFGNLFTTIEAAKNYERADQAADMDEIPADSGNESGINVSSA